jgi:hypothetical protein
MPSTVRPLILAILGTSFLAGCGAPGVPATATVTMIDRKCDIIESIDRQVDDPSGSGVKIHARELNSKTGECKSVDEWEDVRKKRTKDVKGTATVHVDYQAPQDGSSHSATLTFTGRDDEFYKLNAGDNIAIIVANDDPTKIRKG